MTQSNERGQILIIFTVVLVVLLGFMSLAVDVGMIYGDRRYNQSIADSASLAGAGAAAQYMEKNGITWRNFTCANAYVVYAHTVAFNSASARAATNLVSNLDNNITDLHGIEITCVNDPGHFEKHIDVHTQVTSKVPTSFLQIFFNGEVKNTVNAVARIHPRTELAFGHAIVALNESCHHNTDGLVFDGTSDVTVHGGGVLSNSCLTASGKVSVDVINGDGIDYYGALTLNGTPTLSPNPAQIPGKMPIPKISPPNCSASAAQEVKNVVGTISPGNYSLISPGNGVLTLEPGLYCLTGDLTVNGGTTIVGDGVTIYMKKDGNRATSLTINGSAEAHLNAPTQGSLGASRGGKVGILVYMAAGNEGVIKMEGNADSSFTGAVYGPDATIDVGGTSATNPTYNTQLIGKSVKVHGTSDIDINYENSHPYTEEPQLDMTE